MLTSEDLGEIFFWTGDQAFTTAKARFCIQIASADRALARCNAVVQVDLLEATLSVALARLVIPRVHAQLHLHPTR